jgi:autotransporter-associated beta strand protein
MKGAAFFLRGTSTGAINITGGINLDSAEMVITDGTPVTIGGTDENYSGFRTSIAFGTVRTLVSDALGTGQKLILGQNGANQASSLFLGDGSTAVSQSFGGIRTSINGTNTTNPRIAGGATTNSTLTLNLQGATQVDTYPLPLGGTGTNENNLNFVKAGPGRLNLNGISPYTGATTVQGGILQVGGNLSGTSGVAVQAGATLGGTGTVTSVNASGTAGSTANVSPGALAATGILTAATATLGPDSGFNWEVTDWSGVAGTGFDRLNLTGAATLSATPANPLVIRIDDINLPLDNFTETSKTFDIVTAAGGITGFDLAAITLDASGFTSGIGTWSVSLAGTALRLTYSGTPYGNWIASKGLSGANALPDADPDFDGIKNAIEFVLATEPNPANPNSMSVADLPDQTLDATYLTVVYRRADISATALPKIEYGTDLIGWTTAVDSVDGVIITTVDDGIAVGIDEVTVKIPRGTNTELFARLNATIP